jgi:hypothetical protein
MRSPVATRGAMGLDVNKKEENINGQLFEILLTVAYIMQYNLNTLGGDVHHEIERFS